MATMERHLTEHLPGLEDLRHTGRLALSMLAIAGGTAAGLAEMAVDSPDAAGYHVQKIHPVKAYPHQAGYHDNGIIIANVPYGYYIGRAFASSNVRETSVTKLGDYAFGAVTQLKGQQPIVQCGWFESKSLTTTTQTLQGPQPCAKRREVLSDQYSFGHHFNSPPGASNDGSYVTHLTPQCNDRLYANDASLEAAIAGGTFAPRFKNGRGLYDYIGTISNTAPVHYRYTTLDNRAAVVRTDKYGWGFLSKACIAGFPKGGPPNTDGPRKAVRRPLHSTTVLDNKTARVVGQLAAVEVF
jgi:hypothetical protein